MIRKVKFFKQSTPNPGMLEKMAENASNVSDLNAEILKVLTKEEILELNQAMLLVEFIADKIIESGNREMASRFLSNTDAVTTPLEKHFKIGRFNPKK